MMEKRSLSKMKLLFKVTELMAENAHLAGELLRAQNKNEKSMMTSEREDELREEFKELMDERENIWKRKEEALMKEQYNEIMKLRDEFKEQLRSHDEEWIRKLNEKDNELKNEMKNVLELQNKLKEEKHRIQFDQVKLSEKNDRYILFIFSFLYFTVLIMNCLVTYILSLTFVSHSYIPYLTVMLLP